MKVVLVEDSPLVRKHLLAALKEQPFLSVVGLAATEAEALCTVGLTRPHVVVLDLALAAGSGLEVLRKLRLAGYGGTILVLSNREAEIYGPLCVSNGANAFYDKGREFEKFLADLNVLAEAPRLAASQPMSLSSLQMR
ncbi:response regulator [Mitsuaria sp. CC2]|jgi:DNA-binding NarL/FixJ family response regulator|uniref:response regulator transcription factor n=1 Tax=Mitsuaria sp. CC2 TaxID=3029186 RepID=UPI0011F47F89|nr:MAG: response regulator transcription factor [Rubrivivax sp.]